MKDVLPRNLLGDLIVGIDHVGIVVDDLDAHACAWIDLLGVPIAHREAVDSQRVEAAFLDLPDGGAAVELVAPTQGNENLRKFLETRRPGMHHLAFAVSDLTEALRRLGLAGVPLIDKAPRPGARGHRVAFLHPKATGGTLIELVERAH